MFLIYTENTLFDVTKLHHFLNFHNFNKVLNSRVKALLFRGGIIKLIFNKSDSLNPYLW